MNRTLAFAPASILVAAATLALVSALGACSSDADDSSANALPPDASASVRLSGKGEACRVSGDCADPLVCLATTGGGGVCTTGQFNVKSTGNVCSVTQCQEPIDCCPASMVTPDQCAAYKAQCDANPDGSASPCVVYNLYCNCDGSKFVCSSGSCSSKCSGDAECGAGKCDGAGRCVQCTQDAHCGSRAACVAGRCQKKCTSDGECPAYNRCTAGSCVESGCKTDRECIAATHNVDAKCGADGECSIACKSDLECGNPKEFTFFACVEERCTYLGCETDKDCALFYTRGSDAGASGQRYSCQSK